MKNLNLTMGSIRNSLRFGVAVFAIAFMASCSDDAPAPENTPEEGPATEQNLGASVKVITDASILDQYVTNYGNTGSRASRFEATAWEMPDLATYAADYTLGVDDNIDYNAGGNYVVPAETEVTLTWPTFNSNKGYSNLIVYGKLTIEGGLNGNGNFALMVAPGAQVVYKGSYTMLNTSNKSLYIFAGGSYEGIVDPQNGASVYVDQDFNREGDLYIGGNLYVSGNINVGGTLTTNNARIVAPTLTVDNTWMDQNNASNIEIENYIKIEKACTVRCQSVVITKCFIVNDKLEIVNAANFNVEAYIKATEIKIDASGWQINMGGNALIDAGSKLHIVQNGGVNINFDNTADNISVIQAREINGNVQNYQNIPSIDFMNISGFADIQYETINSNCEWLRTQQSVTDRAGVAIKGGEDDCKPSAMPLPDNGDNDPLPPTITEVLSAIDSDHTHDISATCIALYNGKAYISWHKRGSSIHGCVEALQMNDNQASLTSWMETETGSTQGGNNWDGNSAVSGADAAGEVQGEYDFNHLIVVEENGVPYIVTVGDNAKKGGFIGAIPLDADGNFGTRAQASDAFVARQLLGAVEQKVGRSGNAVVRTSDGTYMMACAGGFQEYTGQISQLGAAVYYEKSGNLQWRNKLGQYSLTDGSAKHIALSPDGQMVATLEFTQRSTNVAENDDYWFNDTETRLPATLKMRRTDNWLDSQVWSVDIPAISPIYGKNVIAIDNNGDVYVSEGVNGLSIYNNGNKVGSFSIADYDAEMGVKYAGGAVNGLAIDSQYVYLAYGTAGLWILNKSNLEVVSYYTQDRASANYIAVDNQYIYLAYGRNGVKVLKLQ